jgi:ParB-like nuclease domain
MASTTGVLWGEAPDEHDYPAAADYLALLAPAAQISAIVAALKQAPIVHKKAKDLLRASRLALLPIDNPHVQADLKKIKKGKALSPILVVRGDLTTGVALQIADGYHRVCASYYTDENTDIPVRIVPATN